MVIMTNNIFQLICIITKKTPQNYETYIFTTDDSSWTWFIRDSPSDPEQFPSSIKTSLSKILALVFIVIAYHLLSPYSVLDMARHFISHLILIPGMWASLKIFYTSTLNKNSIKLYLHDLNSWKNPFIPHSKFHFSIFHFE